jgi:hypothetical protein
VCLGAQKCFLTFAEQIARKWETSPLSFNEGYYKAAAAKATVFRWVDQMIGRSDWYRLDRGYKSQTVTYTIAWLADHIAKQGKSGLDLQRIWNQQELPVEVEQVLTVLAPQIAAAIRATPDLVRNVGEFCKQQGCWAMISKTEFDVPSLPDTVLVNHEDAQDAVREAVAIRGLDVDIEFDSLLVELAPIMGEILAFARNHSLLSPRSDLAISKIARGQFVLTSPERNAMRHLIGKIVERGYQLPKSGTVSLTRRIKLTDGATRRVKI